MTRTLVYYPAFPHYRREILRELKERANGEIAFMGGTVGKDSIRSLTRQDIEFLTELDSFRIGPFGWQRGVVRRAISSDYDVVILGPATVSISTWAILLGRKLVRRRNYLWGNCGKVGDRSAKRYVQEVMNRLAHGLLVYGESEASAATDFGTPLRKVHIVNNATRRNEEYLTRQRGIESFQRMQVRTREAVDHRRMILAYVGRLTEAKKVSTLLEASRQLRQEYQHLEVLVIGGGSAEDRLRRTFDDPFIRFLGEVYDPEELNRLLEEATLVVSPFDMGLVAVDAIRVGVPVLMPDNPRNGPEVEALTEGVNSVRFCPGDSASIVGAAEHWLQVAPQITEVEYTLARNRALQKWSPASVAAKILDAVDS